ncbi:hypothetical protein B0O99DRAFT_600054 [Bisporella sp. PMI_857]|nr:hypothetical protein B0O99DRAFT_600054 [Bisporella sp. PMI_857]
MALPSKITIRYVKPGTQPPIYLAGSFSNPPWIPLPMEYTTDDHNEHVFHKEVNVEEGQDYQYKFRVGEGDWWLLDEESPTVTDDIGNRNNLLSVPVHNKENTKPEVIPHPSAASISQFQASHVVDKEESNDPHIGPLSESATTTPTPAHKHNTTELVETSVRKEKGGDQISPPILVVEKVDAAPVHGDDFGPDATASQKRAHDMRAEDAEPDYVVVKPDDGLPDVSKETNGLSEAVQTFDRDALKSENLETKAEGGPSRNSSSTPITVVAETAAEVAESAANLDRDRDVATPEITDEEAGRIGFRRMSSTPIPEVANTAAEVADVAAKLDKDGFKVEVPPSFNDYEETPSGKATPREELVPLFSHECMSPPDEDDVTPLPPQVHDYTKAPQSPYEEAVYDPNDPNIEEFPTDRKSIMEQLRKTSRSLKEDEVHVELEAPSPVIGPNHRHENHNLPVPSPHILAETDEHSPSLGPIQEEGQDYRDEPLVSLPNAILQPKPNFEGASKGDQEQNPNTNSSLSEEEEAVQQSAALESPPTRTPMQDSHITPGPVMLPDTPFSQDDNKRLGEGDEPQHKIETHQNSPDIVVSPATSDPNPVLEAIKNPSKPVDSAEASAIEVQNDRGNLKQRKDVPNPTERPPTPLSTRSHNIKSDNFLRNFFKIVFVEWIGGFITRLCGGRRHTLLALVAALVLIIAPALYLRVVPDSLRTYTLSLYRIVELVGGVGRPAYDSVY